MKATVLSKELMLALPSSMVQERKPLFKELAFDADAR